MLGALSLDNQVNFNSSAQENGYIVEGHNKMSKSHFYVVCVFKSTCAFTWSYLFRAGITIRFT